MNYTTEIKWIIKWIEGCIDVLQKDRESIMAELNLAIDNLMELKATLHGKKLSEQAKIKIGVQD